MKIIIIQGAFLPVPTLLGGAVEKRWFAMAKEFVRMGNEVVYISRSYQGLPDNELTDGIQHRRIKGYSTPKSGMVLKMYDLFYSWRACKEVPLDADIIITNTFWSPMLLSKTLLQKVLVDVARIPKGQMKFYTRSKVLRANSTIVAQLIKAEISAKYHDKVQMIPNPLPLTVDEMVEFEKKEKEILYTGRIHPEKGLEILVKAFSALDTSWKLNIVGPWEIESGGGGASYLKQLKALGQGADIDFCGAVYDMEKLNDFYRSASIFVYPSVAERGETFGLAPLEAMAWGCAPVVSDLACFKDFIIHHENGVIFNHRTENASIELSRFIEELQNNDEYRKKIGSNALKVQETHSTKSISNQFLALFSLPQQ